MAYVINEEVNQVPGMDGTGPTRRGAGNRRRGGRCRAQMRMAGCGRGFARGCGRGNRRSGATEELYLQKTILQERLAAVEKQIQSL